MTLAVVILAAGKSTRFKSDTPKVLHDFGERPMIDYNIELATALSGTPPILVVGEETEGPLREWAGDRVRFAFQEKRLGTGHAVLQTREMLQGKADRVLVLYGDMPLLRTSTLQRLCALQDEQQAKLAMITIIRDESQGFGRVLRDDTGKVVRVVEEPEATPNQLQIRELNAGIYIYDAGFLWDNLPKIAPSAEKGEIYLTDMVELATTSGGTVADLVLEDPSEAMGINTRVDFAAALSVLRQRINDGWMLAGVTLVDPASTYIGPDVTLGRDTIVLPNTHLKGATTIGANCEIGPNTVIESSTIGDRCRVTASVIEHSEMEHDTDIGPFSHLRPGSRVCTGAHIGNFAEMKKSTLGAGSHMGHFSYLGDTTTGEHVNVGAGTITCNYDGKQKHRTTIGDHVFVGSDSLLIAPVKLGDWAKTGAGSVVTHDVPDRTIVYGVPAR
ncbi:MAG: bifunctional UDP-N-acetylglucosamine diphosphorylase/glucosamine-1-phosphate N-acetyltransferase GlmU, partial [Anaerolineae bacterium]|nr:bifunctional UDP-N-acetylglucosamine diphosphorylase/glucosamine-1-phosphate N-acetyltransferase GlmU [Anaerolineae bacterium]